MKNEASRQSPLDDHHVRLLTSGWVVKAVILPHEVNRKAIEVLREKLPDIAFRQFQCQDMDGNYSKKGLQFAIPLSNYNTAMEQKIQDAIDNLMKKIGDAIEASYYLSMELKKE